MSYLTPSLLLVVTFKHNVSPWLFLSILVLCFGHRVDFFDSGLAKHNLAVKIIISRGSSSYSHQTLRINDITLTIS